MFGKLIASPIRLVNAPLRAVEKSVSHAMGEPDRKQDRILSDPLESVAESVEEAFDGEKKD